MSPQHIQEEADTPPADAGPTKHGFHAGDESMSICERLYYLKHLMKVSIIGQISVKDAMAVGLLAHAGRARWFKLNFATTPDAWTSIRAAIVQEAERQPLPVEPGSEARAVELLHEYVSFWATKPKPVVLAAEMQLGPVKLWDDSDEVATSRPDDLSQYLESAGVPAFGDMKTTSAPISDVVKYYDANHGQFLMEHAIYRALGQPNGETRTVVLDVARKEYGTKHTSPEKRFQRVPITIEDHQIRSFLSALKERRKRRREIDSGAAPTPNFSACTRVVAGGIVVRCEYTELCKYGRSAAARYSVNGVPAGSLTREQGAKLW